MKKALLIFIPVILVITGIILYTGIKTTDEISVEGCSATYERYVIPNTLCQLTTGGHCPSSGLNEGNAKDEVGMCLCGKYEASESRPLAISIEELARETGNFEGKIDFIYPLEGKSAPFFTDLSYLERAQMLCDHKEYIFGKTYID